MSLPSNSGRRTTRSGKPLDKSTKELKEVFKTPMKISHHRAIIQNKQHKDWQVKIHKGDTEYRLINIHCIYTN